jgi:hypothetical protein
VTPLTFTQPFHTSFWIEARCIRCEVQIGERSEIAQRLANALMQVFAQRLRAAEQQQQWPQSAREREWREQRAALPHDMLGPTNRPISLSISETRPTALADPISIVPSLTVSN